MFLPHSPFSFAPSIEQCTKFKAKEGYKLGATQTLKPVLFIIIIPPIITDYGGFLDRFEILCDSIQQAYCWSMIPWFYHWRTQLHSFLLKILDSSHALYSPAKNQGNAMKINKASQSLASIPTWLEIEVYCSTVWLNMLTMHKSKYLIRNDCNNLDPKWPNLRWSHTCTFIGIKPFIN